MMTQDVSGPLLRLAEGGQDVVPRFRENRLNLGSFELFTAVLEKPVVLLVYDLFMIRCKISGKYFYSV